MLIEYKCENCDIVFEYKKNIKDNAPKTVKCPKCKSKKTHRLWSIGGIGFKGSGFYVNDYKKKK